MIIFLSDYPRLERSLQFLKVHLEPWEEIKECWEYTNSFRLNQLRDQENKDLKVADYIYKYPVLRQPGGHLLVRVLFFIVILQNVHCFQGVIFNLYVMYLFQQLEYNFEFLFKGARNRMLSHWSKFAAKVTQELINIGVPEEYLDEIVISFLKFLKLYASLSLILMFEC